MAMAVNSNDADGAGPSTGVRNAHAEPSTSASRSSAVDGVDMKGLNLGDSDTGQGAPSPALTTKKKKSGGNKKGANPLKAQLKAGSRKGAGQADDIKPGISKGETEQEGGGPVSTANANTSSPSHGSFTSFISGPVITLRFTSKAAQHRALSRVETYYEGVDEKLQGYQSWGALMGALQGKTPSDIAERGLCKGYEAFNLPLSVVGEWVEEMRRVEEREADLDLDSMAWVGACCLAEEVELLRFLEAEGVLSIGGDGGNGGRNGNAGGENAIPGGGSGVNASDSSDTNANDGGSLNVGTPRQAEQPQQQQQPPSPTSSTPPRYLISTTSSTSLLHEQLHALYHLSQTYAAAVHSAYTQQLGKKSRKVIEHDLTMRGYRSTVWEDEWQAYLLGSSAGDAEGPGEATWGKGPREECLACRDTLRVVAVSEGGICGVAMPAKWR